MFVIFDRKHEMRHLRLIENKLLCELVVTSKFLSSWVLHLIY